MRKTLIAFAALTLMTLPVWAQSAPGGLNGLRSEPRTGSLKRIPPSVRLPMSRSPPLVSWRACNGSLPWR